MGESHPSRVSLFRAWCKAMIEGATVGRPNYGKTLTGSSIARPRASRRRRSTHPRRMRQTKMKRS